MTSTCVICGATFAAYDPRRPRRTCSPTCQGRLAWADRPRGRGYTKLYLPGHPLADERGAVGEHRAVLYAKLGPGTHPCHWCSRPVTWRPVGGPRRGGLTPDHLDGDPRNNDPTNLVPSCSGCNSGRGLPNAIREGELFVIRGRKRAQRLRAERRTCILCGAEFLHRISAAGPGLYCSKSCAAREKQRPNAIHEDELFITPPNGKRVRAVEQQCAKCGQTFLARAVVVQAGGGRYCSKSCASRDRGKAR